MIGPACTGQSGDACAGLGPLKVVKGKRRGLRVAPIDSLAGDLQLMEGIIVKLARQLCFKRVRCRQNNGTMPCVLMLSSNT